MFASTSPSLALGFGGALSSRALRKALVENKRNAWRLTNYKLGGRLGVPSLFALDRAGNIICYFSFNKTSRFGWSMAEEDPDNFSFSYPLQWRAALLREELSKDKIIKTKVPIPPAAAVVVPVETTASAATKSLATVAADAGNVASKTLSNKTSTATADGTGAREEMRGTVTAMSTPEAAAAAAAASSTSPSFKLEEKMIHGELISLRSRRLRLYRLSTFMYKSLYWSLVAATTFLFFLQYLLFRQWLNYPAREGLKRWEAKVMEKPNEAFNAAVYSFEEAEQIPEGWKVGIVSVLQTISEAGLEAARSVGYNPNHDALEAARLRALEEVQVQTQRESIEWGRWAKYGVMVCLTVACLL